MKQLISILLAASYQSLFSPKRFYSRYATDINLQNLMISGVIFSVLTSFSIGLWFTYTAGIFGLNTAGGLTELLMVTSIGGVVLLLFLVTTALLTQFGLSIIGLSSEFRDLFSAYIFSLPVLFLLLQIPVINVFMPIYLIYVQIIGISELAEVKMIEAGLAWSIQGIVYSLVLLVPVTYYSLQMISII